MHVHYHFRFVERLGAGASGTVWKARDTELDWTVAVKIPRKEQLSANESQQFLREARAAAQLQHLNIVSVHGVGREDDTIYIISGFVEGLSLSKWQKSASGVVVGHAGQGRLHLTAVTSCSQYVHHRRPAGANDWRTGRRRL